MSSPLLWFPTEILEKILYYVDPETLQNVQEIDSYWSSVVSSMLGKKNYWEKVCKQYINEYDLFEIQKTLSPTESESADYWKLLYKHWHSWSNLDTIEINVHKFPTKEHNGEIYCTKIVEDHLLFANNLSYVYHYNLNTGRFVTKHPHGTVPILEIDAMDVQTTKKLNFKSPYVFLKFDTDHVVMYQFHEENSDATRFRRIKLYEVKFFRLQRDRFVYSDRHHVLRVGVMKNVNDQLKLVPLYWVSLGYRELIGLSIWKSFVTTLYDGEMEVYKFRNLNKVAEANYDDPCSRSLIYTDTNKFRPIPRTTLDVAFYNGVSVSVSYGTVCVKSLIHRVHKRFKYYLDYGVPCSVLLYGRILMIGVEQGKLYLYRVDDWTKFKLQNYTRMLKMDSFLDPVSQISVHEIRNKHRIVVTNTWNVRFFDIDF